MKKVQLKQLLRILVFASIVCISFIFLLEIPLMNWKMERITSSLISDLVIGKHYPAFEKYSYFTTYSDLKPNITEKQARHYWSVRLQNLKGSNISIVRPLKVETYNDDYCAFSKTLLEINNNGNTEQVMIEWAAEQPCSGVNFDKIYMREVRPIGKAPSAAQLFKALNPNFSK